MKSYENGVWFFTTFNKNKLKDFLISSKLVFFLLQHMLFSIWNVYTVYGFRRSLNCWGKRWGELFCLRYYGMYLLHIGCYISLAYWVECVPAHWVMCLIFAVWRWMLISFFHINYHLEYFFYIYELKFQPKSEPKLN